MFELLTFDRKVVIFSVNNPKYGYIYPNPPAQQQQKNWDKIFIEI